MAEVAFNTPIEDPDGGGYHYVASTTLTTNDTTAPINAPGQGDRSVAVKGNFGTNAVITVEGANTKGVPTAADWQTLRDSFGNNLTFTAAGLKQIHERCKWLRATCTSGTSPALDVTFFMPRRAA